MLGLMTKLEDMSETERQSWMTLLVDVSVFIWFVSKMTYGRFPNLSLETISPDGLMKLYISVIVITLILHAVIAAIFAARRRSDHTEEKDERDILIDRKGAAYGFGFLAVMLNIVTFMYLFENTVDGYDFWLSLNNVSHMFFVLLSLAFVGDIIKNTVMVLAFRGE